MKNLRNIVVGYDFSKISLSALKQALHLASQFEATLHVVHVLAPEIASPFVPSVSVDLQSEVEKNLKEQLNQFVQEHHAKPLSVGVHVIQGLVYDQMIDVAKRVSADLVVVGSHSRHFLGRMLLGSQALKLVRHSPVPVLVHHADLARVMKTILVPVDENESSESAIDDAKFFAKAYGAKVQLIHVLNLPTYDYLDSTQMLSEAKTECEKYLKGLSIKHELQLPPLVLQGSPSREIRTWVEQHDDVALVVLTTHGRKGVDRFLLGSVAEQIVQAMPVDVLSTRTEEHTKYLSNDFEKGLLF